MKSFGTRAEGQAYRLRPGAYGLAWQAEESLLLLVETADGLEIPGGGIEEGESAEQALRREFLEETGCSIRSSYPLFSLRQILNEPWRGKFYDKRCTFFAVELDAAAGRPQEEGHRPVWCKPQAALGHMAEECQDWLLGGLSESGEKDRNFSRLLLSVLSQDH